jgi:hypothetical protein
MHVDTTEQVIAAHDSKGQDRSDKYTWDFDMDNYTLSRTPKSSRSARIPEEPTDYFDKLDTHAITHPFAKFCDGTLVSIFEVTIDEWKQFGFAAKKKKKKEAKLYFVDSLKATG